MDKQLDAALTVAGFETRRNAHRVVFTSTDVPPRTVIWRVSAEALSAHIAWLRRDAQDAWGSKNARGEWPLAVHVEEALLTFEGDRGEMVLEQSALRVHAIE